MESLGYPKARCFALCPPLATPDVQRVSELACFSFPVYLDGSNVFERVGHVLPLAQGQRSACSKGHFKVAANCSLRPGKPDGRQFEFVKLDGSLLSCPFLATTIIC